MPEDRERDHLNWSWWTSMPAWAWQWYFWVLNLPEALDEPPLVRDV